jgi:hypothetical protein
MPDERDDSIPPGRLRVMQIITGAPILGVVITLGIFVFLVQVPNQGRPFGPGQGPPILSVLALGTLAVLAVASGVLPDVVLRQGLRSIARGEGPPPTGYAGRLLLQRQTTLIMGLALLEAPALFCCIAYLLEGRLYTVGGAVLAVLLMASRFPTESGLRAWLRRRLDAVEEERRRIYPDAAP